MDRQAVVFIYLFISSLVEYSVNPCWVSPYVSEDCTVVFTIAKEDWLFIKLMLIDAKYYAHNMNSWAFTETLE